MDVRTYFPGKKVGQVERAASKNSTAPLKNPPCILAARVLRAPLSLGNRGVKVWDKIGIRLRDSLRSSSVGNHAFFFFLFFVF